MQAFAVGESASAGIEGVVEDGMPGTLADDHFLDNDGFKYEETADVLRVTITPQN